MVAKIKRHFSSQVYLFFLVCPTLLKFLINQKKKMARDICRQEKKHKIFVFSHFSTENELKTILKSKAIRKSTRGDN